MFPFLKTLLLHMMIWILLPIFKFSRMKNWLRERALGNQRKRVDDPQKVVGLVTRTSRLLPGTNCLTEALCCMAILLRNGFDAKLILGLERSNRGKLDAHAWIELDDKVILGDNGNLDKYKTLQRRRK